MAQEKMITKAYKFEIFPTEDQIHQIMINIGHSRFIYNHYLFLRTYEYERFMTEHPEKAREQSVKRIQRAVEKANEKRKHKKPIPTADEISEDQIRYYHRVRDEQCEAELATFPFNEKTGRPSMGALSASKAITALKNTLVDEDGHKWLYDADSTSITYAYRHLDAAYQNFFTRVAKGDPKAGYPKFKKKDRGSISSYSINGNSVKLEGNRIKLPKVGAVKIALYRPVIGHIQCATVSITPSGRFWISLQCKDVPLTPTEAENTKQIGMAFGTKKLVTTTNGEVFENTNKTRDLNRRIARFQRQLDKCEYGSNRYEKKRKQIARLHEHIRNIRSNRCHAISNALVTKNADMVVPKYNIANMIDVKKHKYRGTTARVAHRKNTELIDASLFELRRQIEYKAKWHDRNIEIIDLSRRTTKIARECSECGYIHEELSLNDRTWTCPVCGTTHVREENNAKNVLHAAQTQ